MVRWIADRFGDGAPRRILTTSGPAPTHCHAFCELGGHHVIDKRHPLDRMRIMWETVAGRRWQLEVEDVAGFSVIEANGALLPYMEHAGWRRSAERDLGISAGTLGARKTRLAVALGIPGDSDRTQFVAAAHRQGLVWVPLIHRHLLAPEHRGAPGRTLRAGLRRRRGIAPSRS